MIEYWSVIGRGVTDKPFRDELFGCNTKERTHSMMPDLYHFLCGPVTNLGCGLRLSRWEICDINRLSRLAEEEFSKNPTGKTATAIANIGKTWNRLRLGGPEAHGLLGLVLIDTSLLHDYQNVKTVAEFKQRAAESPVFHFRGLQTLKIFYFFKKHAKDLDVLAEKAWIPPKKSAVALAAVVMGFSAVLFMFKSSKTRVQCSGGQTLMPPKSTGLKIAYTHLAPPFIDRLAARIMPQRFANFLGI